ncbi:MAG: MopE-related protein [Polyangiales bacterium]
MLAAAALRCEVAQVVGAAPSCAPGAVERCPARSSCGRCPEATRACGPTGRWGPCVAAGRGGAYFVCDVARDEDCDGVCNADERACRCTSRDAARACYDGPTGTLDVGRCRAGTQDCAAGRFGPCGGALVTPAAIERCGDGVDDDCDGAVDDDCAAPRVLAVAVGDASSCALVRDGSGRALVCWGAGAGGVFEEGSADRARPTRVAAPAGVTALAMGASHVCVIASEGAVWCAGGNDAGQLGQASLDARAGFVRVPGVVGASSLAAGRRHTCALTANGRAWCWGSDRVGQAGGDVAGLVACATGGDRGCRVGAREVAGVGGATAITAGFEHTCVQTAAGARCWGEGAAIGAAGVAAPTAVFAGEAVESLVAGRRGTCARIGARWRCLGDARAAVDGVEGAVLAAGARWCAAGDGGVRCTSATWGDEATTGREGLLDAMALTPAGAVTSLAVGLQHACAAVRGETVVCWGGPEAARHGQLGDPRAGDTEAREVWW